MSFFNNRPLVITVIILIILLVCLITTSGGDQVGILGRLLAPVQQGIYSITGNISDSFDDMFTRSGLEEENQQLQNEIAKLKSELQDYEELKQENERLTELLALKDSHKDYDIVTARVIGRAIGEWYDSFTINVGKNDGIKKNMVVMTQDGIVGRVVEVSVTYSKVMPIINASSGVSALLERSRENCVVSGNTSNSQAKDDMEVLYLDDGADVVPGDKIVTSGLDGIYPKGIKIGEVSQVLADGVVLMRSEVSFDTLEEVVILMEKSE